MTPLYGHTSQETAYMVNDYPYGRDRCRIRFWLESDPKRGFRFCSQTEHPRKLIWNAPKKSTYALLAGCMYLDEKGHVVWDGLSEYSKDEDVLQFIAKFPGADLSKVKEFAGAKCRYLEGLISGRIVWKINNEAKPTTETECTEYQASLVLWQQVVSKF